MTIQYLSCRFSTAQKIFDNPCWRDGRHRFLPKPLLAVLLCLVHLWITDLLSVLCRAGSVDDRCIYDCSAFQHVPCFYHRSVDCFKKQFPCEFVDAMQVSLNYADTSNKQLPPILLLRVGRYWYSNILTYHLLLSGKSEP